jgi:hypothetical protein
VVLAPDDTGADADARDATAAEIPAELLGPLEPGSILPPLAEATEALTAVRRVTMPSLAARRPRFSPDGTTLVFFAGPEEAGEVWVVRADGSGLARLTDHPADDRDPTWDRTGERIVWSSNREGTYDLWMMNADGSGAERLTDLAADELEPAVSPLPYRFFAVTSSACGAQGREVDAYDKVAFTLREGGRTEVWFQSLHGLHRGRLSPERSSCHAPSWAGNGRSLAWACDGPQGPVVFEGEAQWDYTFADAVAAVTQGGRPSGAGATRPQCPDAATAAEIWRTDECFWRLPRRYAGYVAEPRSRPAERLGAPAYSANQILLLAESSGAGAGLHLRPRGDGDWTPLRGAPAGARQPDWSPDGRRLAFESDPESGPVLYVADADFYLQDVRDLVDYPELYGAGASALLQRNRFVARPGTQQEFFALYEQARRKRRAPFVTADAMLQAFHDEFALLLRRAEETAQAELLRLCRGLFELYVDRLSATGTEADRFYAVHFAVPYALLEAARQVLPVMATGPAPELFEEAARPPGGRLRALAPENPPVADQLARIVPGLVAGLPAAVRGEVDRRIAQVLAHAGLVPLQLPDREQPVDVDFAAFRVRGHYATGPLVGYFLATTWLELVPLPLDQTALDLVTRMDTAPAPPPPPEAPTRAGMFDILPPPAPAADTLGELWDDVNAFSGTLLGRPQCFAVPHLRLVAREHPERTVPFDRDRVLAALATLCELPASPEAGEEPDGAAAGPPELTFLPRRQGLDEEFFAQLTAGEVPGRTRPTALDLFAVLGDDRARQLALAGEEGQDYVDAYRSALDRLRHDTAEGSAGLLNADVYHSWLALLAALARPAAIPEASVLYFARTEAWHDRQLLSALGGYALLRHDAPLFAVEDFGGECAEEQVVVVFTEQPELPPPRGFVDPVPRFFRLLARLADRVYGDLAGGIVPRAWAEGGTDDAPAITICARDIAERLALLADKEVHGLAPTADETEWLRYIGAYFEAVVLREVDAGQDVPPAALDPGRARNGIALASRAFAEAGTGRELELAVGRILDLYVVLPDDVGQRLTRGGIFSFYESWQPAGERPADEDWIDRLERGAVPSLPEWTSSFVEPPPAAETVSGLPGGV